MSSGFSPTAPGAPSGHSGVFGGVSPFLSPPAAGRVVAGPSATRTASRPMSLRGMGGSPVCRCGRRLAGAIVRPAGGTGKTKNSRLALFPLQLTNLERQAQAPAACVSARSLGRRGRGIVPGVELHLGFQRQRLGVRVSLVDLL